MTMQKIQESSKDWQILLIAFTCLLIVSCGGSSSSSSNATRPFYMGFTPWPYAATVKAVDDTYAKIQNNGDIVAHHLDGGIPWSEALAGSTYPASVEGELNSRISQTKSDKVIYLAVNPLNLSRTDIADYWSASTGEPLTAPWDSRGFDHPDVISAYSNFSLNLIGRFNPVYFNYAIEINELMVNQPAKYDEFVIFAEQVYANIKALHPDLVLMISLTMKSPGSSDMAIAQSGFDRIKDYVDLVGISTYGYAFYSHADKGDPANLPANWLSQVSSIAPGKPVAISETGWIAEDLDIPSFSLDVMSDNSKQDAYVKLLFEQARQLDAQFLIWFTVVDFDDLWLNVLGQDPIAHIWRDTGLYDESLQSRSGLTRWQTWFRKRRL